MLVGDYCTEAQTFESDQKFSLSKHLQSSLPVDRQFRDTLETSPLPRDLHIWEGIEGTPYLPSRENNEGFVSERDSNVAKSVTVSKETDTTWYSGNDVWSWLDPIWMSHEVNGVGGDEVFTPSDLQNPNSADVRQPPKHLH